MNQRNHTAEPDMRGQGAEQLSSLLYISRSTILPRNADASVTNIVAVSLARNVEHGVTGALLFTGQYFAQVLEGTDAMLDTIMASILRDERHRQILVVVRDPIAQRRFADWSLAYFGPSEFVSRHVTRLLDNPPLPASRRSAEWLNDLLWEFSHGGGAE